MSFLSKMAFVEEKDYEQVYEELFDLFAKYTQHNFEYASEKEDVLVQLNPSVDALNILLVVSGKRMAYMFYPYEDQSDNQKGWDEIYDVTEDLSKKMKNLLYLEFTTDDTVVTLDHNYGIWVIRKNLVSLPVSASAYEKIDFPMANIIATSSDLVTVEFKLIFPKNDKKEKEEETLIFFRMVNNPSKIMELQTNLSVYKRVANAIDLDVILVVNPIKIISYMQNNM
jgi:hypothetical protein